MQEFISQMPTSPLNAFRGFGKEFCRYLFFTSFPLFAFAVQPALKYCSMWERSLMNHCLILFIIVKNNQSESYGDAFLRETKELLKIG